MTSAFIHEFPDLESFELLCESNESFLNDFEIKERAFMDEMEMFQFMGESTEDLEYMFESEKKNFFETVGEKILQIIDWLKKKFSEMTEKVAGLFNKTKKTNEEIDAAWRKQPELAKAFMDGLRNGSIKYSDYENIDKMVDDACEIIKQLESDKINSKTAVDRFNDVIEKFNKTLVPSATLLATIGAGADGIASIVGFRNKLRKEVLETHKNTQKLEKLRQTAAEAVYKQHGVAFDAKNKKDKNFRFDKDKEPVDANGNIKEHDRQVAAVWALRICQRAASEYSKPKEIMYGFLVKATELITSGKLFDTKKMDAEKFAQAEYKRTGMTAKDHGDTLNELNKMDKAMS